MRATAAEKVDWIFGFVFLERDKQANLKVARSHLDRLRDILHDCVPMLRQNVASKRGVGKLNRHDVQIVRDAVAQRSSTFTTTLISLAFRRFCAPALLCLRRSDVGLHRGFVIARWSLVCVYLIRANRRRRPSKNWRGLIVAQRTAAFRYQIRSILLLLFALLLLRLSHRRAAFYLHELNAPPPSYGVGSLGSDLLLRTPLSRRCHLRNRLRPAREKLETQRLRARALVQAQQMSSRPAAFGRAFRPIRHRDCNECRARTGPLHGFVSSLPRFELL